MTSLLTEATLDKMSKADQEAVRSGDASKIDERISFWKDALEGKALQKNGKLYQEKTAKMYISFLDKEKKRLEETEEKEKEKEETEEKDKDKESPKPYKINVTVTLNDSDES